MVYINDWPEFQSQCMELHKKSPKRTRYLIKARPAKQSLILKVTDDVTTLKFKTKSTVILGRFETFNRTMSALMAGLPEPSTSPSAAKVETAQTGSSSAANPSVAPTDPNNTASAKENRSTKAVNPPTGSGGGTGGGKKKKKKGKK
ncbi:signal recognition particle, SRP9/SRP14 subunit [Violaceomyces palustris]|uniref:Signal recognition particle, SRP9/SRP14 subunit n=1 Tax=Violaceomyces palustris TaxID=1673888 RepID=A0ACD0NWS4_9BASI|nr:signal recognition particle, SRP9/SRP14 subunit [Violaceomyces palustris]